MRIADDLWVDPASGQYIYSEANGAVIGMDGHDFEVEESADAVAIALGETMPEDSDE